MRTLHLFNPGHDEALSAHTPYYTDTRAAQALARALWDLPTLWANLGDEVLSLDGLRDFHRWQAFDAIAPWGWDAALWHRLTKYGAPSSLLPDAEQIETIRTLSSRKTAVKLLECLDKPDGVCSTFASTWEEVEAFVRTHGGAVAKAPWSSSGRGIQRIEATPTLASRRRVESFIKKQGGVSVEPFFHRLTDFALEFTAESDGQLHYEGMSLFLTNAHGAYVGNLVADDDTLCKQLHHFTLDTLQGLKSQIVTHLSPLLRNKYMGPVGIDMMQFEAQGQIFTHPCIEINLRRTMGHVALSLRSRLQAGVRKALFTLSPARQAPPTATLLCGQPEVLAAWWIPQAS